MFNGVVMTLGRSAVLGSLRQIVEIARLFSSAVFPQVDISSGSLLRNFLQMRDSGKSERTSAATFRPLDSGQAPFDGFRRKRPTSSCLGVFGARALVAEALSALRRRVSSPWSRSRVSRWSRALHMARGLSIQGGVTAVCPCLCCSEWIPVLGFLVLYIVALTHWEGLAANVFVRSAVGGLCAEAGAWAVATLLAAAPSDSVLCNAAITASGRTVRPVADHCSTCCSEGSGLALQCIAYGSLCRSRSWCHALLSLEAMKTQLMELTAVTFTGLITAMAGQAFWDLSEATGAAATGPGDWPRGTALLAAMAARRLLSKEAAASAATCCAKHWRKALHMLAYFDLHRRGEVDGVLAGAVINAMGMAHAWPEATSLLGSLPPPVSPASQSNPLASRRPCLLAP